MTRAAKRIDATARSATAEPRRRISRATLRISQSGRQAVVERARALSAQSRAPRDHLDRHRLRLHQLTREMRAAAGRGRADKYRFQRRITANVIARRREASLLAVNGERVTITARAHAVDRATRQVGERATALATTVTTLDRARRALEQRVSEALATRAAALRAHDPERTLERGYALLLDDQGEPLPTAAAARHAGRFDVRLADGSVGAQVIDTDTEAPDGH
jgi:exodeoxyribonuclease VII large subunit